MGIHVNENIGLTEHIVKYSIQDKTHIQHLAILLKVSIDSEANEIPQADDTNGIACAWVDLEEIALENSSPLVVTAKEYLETKRIGPISRSFDDRVVKEESEEER